jgi:hypothetical protein
VAARPPLLGRREIELPLHDPPMTGSNVTIAQPVRGVQNYNYATLTSSSAAR